MKETCRVKLEKLQICQRRARSVGHSQAIASSNIWIAGVKVDFAGATGAECRDPGGESFHLVRLQVQDVRAPALDAGRPGLGQ